MPVEVRRSTLALVVLALLRTAPMHPYQVQLKLKQWGKDNVVNVRQRSGLYRTIERLEEGGLIAVHATEREEQRPERTVYAITDAGRVVMRMWQMELLSTPVREFPQFPAALSVLPVVSEADAIAALARRAEALAAEVAEIKAEMAYAAELGVPRLFTVEDEFVLAITTAEQVWVTGLVAELRAGELRWDEAWIASMSDTFDQLEAHGLDAEGGGPS